MLCTWFFFLPAYAADSPPAAPPLNLPADHGQIDFAALKGRVVYLDFCRMRAMLA